MFHSWMLADLDLTIQTFFIFLITDIIVSFIPSIYAFGFMFFLLLNIHSIFLLFTPELIFSKIFLVFTSFFVMMSFWAFNVVSIRSLLLMSSYLMHNVFSLNFPDAAQYICLHLSRNSCFDS